MKKNKNIRKIAKASLALLISVSYGASAMEMDQVVSGDGLTTPVLSEQPEGASHYEKILKEIEELTARIHREVDKVLEDYKRDTEEYHRRMSVKRGAGTSSTTTSLMAGDEYPSFKDTSEEVSPHDESKAYLKELLKVENPGEEDILLGVKLKDMLKHFPTLDEWKVAHQYHDEPRLDKDFIAAVLYLKDTLGISGEIIGIDNSEGVSANRNPELIVDMKEALAEKENPTEEYLKEKLFFKIFGEAPTAEQRVEIDRQAIDVYNRTTRDTAKVFVNQGLKLKGVNATPENIAEGVRLGGEATLKQVRASIMASKILSEFLDKEYLLNIDQVNAWIYLRDNLKKGIEKNDVNSKIGISNIINKFIPKIIKFQKEGTTPTWSQINSTEISSTSESSGRGRGRGKRGRGRK
jgi:hypothetical protein